MSMPSLNRREGRGDGITVYRLYNDEVGGYYKSERSIVGYSTAITALAVATKLNRHWTPGRWIVRECKLVCVDDYILTKVHEWRKAI